MKQLKLSFAIFFEGVLFLIGGVLFGMLLLAGRLMLGPVVVTGLTPVFENLLSAPESDIYASIGHSYLTWNNERRKAVLDLSDITFHDKLNQAIATVPDVMITVHPLGYFDEAHSPWNVVVENPHMHLRLDKDGKIHLGAMSGQADANTTQPVPEDVKDIVTHAEMVTLLHNILRSPHTRTGGLGLFANLTVINGAATLNDEGKQITWNARVPAFSLRRIKNNYSGKAAMLLSKNNMQTAMDVALTYNADTKIYTVSGSFDHLNPTLFANSIAQLKPFDFVSSSLTGSVSVSVDEDANVIDGGLNLNLDKGEIKVPDFYGKPLPFKNGQIVARYKKDDQVLSVETIRFDFANLVMQGQATIHAGSTPRDVKATFKLNNLPVSQLAEYWPEDAGKNARDWILENIHKGQVDEAVVNLAFIVPDNDVTAASLDKLTGSIKVSDVEMTAWKALPNLTKVNATSTFDMDGFDIQIVSGAQGDILLKPSHVVITGLDDTQQIMTLDVGLLGPAQNILANLDRPPMGYIKKINVDPKQTSGNVDGMLHMSFPLLKDLLFDQIELSAKAKVTDAAVKNVANLVDVSKGTVDIDVDKAHLHFKGDAALNDVPSSVEWMEKFSGAAKEELLSNATITSKPNASDIQKFGVDLNMVSSEAFPVTVTYQRSAAISKLSISADATAPKLELTDLFYTKPAGIPLTITTALQWGDGNPMRLSELKAEGTGINLKGYGQFDSQQHLSSLDINPLQMGETNLKLQYNRGKDNVPNISLIGDVADIRQLLSPGDKPQHDKPVNKEPSSMQIDIRVKKAITGNKSQIDNVSIKGIRDHIGWSMLEASATAKNKTPFNLSFRSSGERPILSAATPNLGNVLSSLDVTDTLIGGKLTIDGKGEPGDKLRNVFGHIKLENYRVLNMPALAQLISAISPDGLAAMLGGDGLGFSDLYGEYVWSRDIIVISKAHTSSGSLGLTTAGKIDMRNSTLELEGQVIPVYFLSRILSAIPLVGDILTGGEGQGLFAATYRVEGPIAKAKVSVNPVSVLAPGFLRNILFMDKDITKMPKQDQD